MPERNPFSMTFVMILIFGYGNGECDISQIMNCMQGEDFKSLWPLAKHPRSEHAETLVSPLLKTKQKLWSSSGGDKCSERAWNTCIQPLIDCNFPNLENSLNQIKGSVLKRCQSSGVHFSPSIFLMFSSFCCFFFRAGE